MPLDVEHEHSVYDSDLHFKINPTTRSIDNESEKITLMQYDHNSERFSFELPRIIEGHDMLQCNKVEVHYINIASRGGQQNDGVYECTDFRESSESNDILVCSWLISSNATQLNGTLNFVLVFKCTDGDKTTYQWCTDIHKGIKINSSINNGEAIIEEYADILQEWYNKFATKSAETYEMADEAYEMAKDVKDRADNGEFNYVLTDDDKREVANMVYTDYIENVENLVDSIAATIGEVNTE